jgi:hypothetical protein
MHENDEIILEAARAMGNLTRCSVAREELHDKRGHEVHLVLLEHGDDQIVCASLGVLVNLSADPIYQV